MTLEMEVPRIDVTQSSLPRILTDMKSGNLQIPRFQRRFVWPVTKTRALLDSIYKEFPIGTFFLWRAPLENAGMFRSMEEVGIPVPAQGQQVSYILDGQQRLSSLFVVLSGIQLGSRDYGRICIDLETASKYDENIEEGFEESIFVYRKPNDERYVAVKDILGSRSFDVYDNLPRKWKPTFQKARKVLENYPFSVVWIQEQKLHDAITIFQRINQGGKPLSRYDLVCANLWANDFDFRKRVSTINEKFDQEGFGELHETIYTQSFALILQDKCTTLAELSLETEAVRSSWDKVIRAINLAVDFASSNLGVKRAGFLPYRGVVPVLAYFFYHSDTPAISADLRNVLWNWFWSVTLSERYSSTSPSRMAEDAALLREALAGKKVEFAYPSKVTPASVHRVRMTQGSSALRNAVLCLLAIKNPLNFKSGGPVNLWDPFFSDLKKTERHHVFPVGYLKKQGHADRVHRVANFCFIPSDLNKEIGSRAPSDYLSVYQEKNPDFRKAMKSHLLPIDESSSLWANDFNRFLDERSKMLADELNKMVTTKPSDLLGETMDVDEFGYGDMVDVAEIRLRDFIDERMKAIVGEAYWKTSIPGDIIGSVKSRIEADLEKHPYRTRAEYSDPRRRLDYCDVTDYKKIIHKNWEIFEEIFRSKSEMDKHFDSYGRFRNVVHHNRELTDLQEREGTLAVSWIQRTLDRYEAEHNGVVEMEEDEEESIESNSSVAGMESDQDANTSQGLSEDLLLEKWTTDTVKGFEEFRDRLMQISNVSIRPQKTTLSFYYETNNKSVFLCYYSDSSTKDGNISFRKDSLEAYLDIPEIIREIREMVGGDVVINEGNVYCSIHFPLPSQYPAMLADFIADNFIPPIG